MKTIKIYTTLFALSLISFAKAQSTTDSLTTKQPVVIDGKKVRITIDTKEKGEETTESKIIIDGDTTILDDGKGNKIEDTKVVKKHKKTYTRRIDEDEEENKKNPSNWFHFDLGFNFLASNGTLDMPEEYKDLELENGKGCNFNLRIYEQSIGIVQQHLYLVYGVGLDWNNYRFKNNVDLIRDSFPLAFTINKDVNYNKNKLVSMYLTAPLMLKVRFKENKKGDAFKIAAGPQFGYLINSHTKQKWEQDGKHKQKVKGDYNLDEFRIGYSVYLGYDNINFYARYYPDSAFKENKGPDVNTVCVGLAIGGF